MRVLYYYADTKAQGEYRCFLPGKYLELADLAEVRYRNAMKQQDICWADVIVFQRQHEDVIHYNFRKAKLQNKAVIYEVDDFLHGISPTSPAYKTYNPKHQAWHGVLDFIKDAHAVTVTREDLRQQYLKYNPNIFVLPNYMDIDLWEKAKKKDNGDIVKIGWSGSTTHYIDLQQISQVLTDIVHEYPNVILRFAGYFPEELFKDIPKDRVEMGECYPFAQYYKVLEHVDINVTPLAMTKFNEAKSSIKYLEASMVGVPTIATKIGPYQDAIKHKETGFLATKYSDWKRYLKLLIEDRSERERIGQNARDHVMKYWTFDTNVWRWREAYEKILNIARGK